MKKILAVIPARYASTRFPAKMLADIMGKTLIQRVYEQVAQVPNLHKVVIATDHPLIEAESKRFGAEVLMTAEHHPSGTDRIQEAYTLLAEHFDYIINIQGDEPFIKPEQIAMLVQLIVESHAPIATLVHAIKHETDLTNPNVVKVVFDKEHFALYFSRNCLPYLRGHESGEWLKKHHFYRHIGLYAYRTDTLAQITKLKTSYLEQAEQLEQLRWLENGFRIKVGVTPHSSQGIDTPEDLEMVLKTHL